MRYNRVFGIIMGATLFLSCSSILYPSREATEKSRVTTVDLSSNAYAVYFDLDSLNCCPEEYVDRDFTPRSPYSPIDRFRCDLADTSRAYVELYDLLGNLRLIWEEDKLPPGSLELDFRDLHLEKGLHIVRMRLNDGEFQDCMLLF